MVAEDDVSERRLQEGSHGVDDVGQIHDPADSSSCQIFRPSNSLRWRGRGFNPLDLTPNSLAEFYPYSSGGLSGSHAVFEVVTWTRKAVRRRRSSISFDGWAQMAIQGDNVDHAKALWLFCDDPSKDFAIASCFESDKICIPLLQRCRNCLLTLDDFTVRGRRAGPRGLSRVTAPSLPRYVFDHCTSSRRRKVVVIIIWIKTRAHRREQERSSVLRRCVSLSHGARVGQVLHVHACTGRCAVR